MARVISGESGMGVLESLVACVEVDAAGEAAALGGVGPHGGCTDEVGLL